MPDQTEETIKYLTEGVRIRAVNAPWYSAIEMLIRVYHGPHDQLAVVENIILRDVDPTELPQASIRLTQEAAQILMDDLWHCGIRPTEGKGSAGALQATEKHLEDMRRLVFQILPAREISDGKL